MQDIVGNLLLKAAVGFQFSNIKWIWQEADVEQKINFAWQSMFKTKRHHSNMKSFLRGFIRCNCFRLEVTHWLQLRFRQVPACLLQAGVVIESEGFLRSVTIRPGC